MSLRIAILTVSDRSARGERQDVSGPALVEAVESQGWQVVRKEILPDDLMALRELLAAWADSGEIDVILTTGGTGFSQRDVTPEATRAVLERELPGVGEAIRLANFPRVPTSILSRAVAGTRGRSLVVNLPGNPRAIGESLPFLVGALAEAVDHLRGVRPVLRKKPMLGEE